MAASRVWYALGWAIALPLVQAQAAPAAEAPLVEAARRHDVATVGQWIARGTDANQASADGTTALHWAVQHDDAALTRRLLDAGARAAVRNRYGMTPLWLAAINGNSKIAEWLLGAGADARQAMPEGDTVLMAASRAGHAEVVRQLLAHGADPNVRESWKGQTALMWAAAGGHVAVITALVEGGADVRARTPKAPRVRGASEADVTHVAGFTPVLFAARSGHIEAVRTLVRAGADVNDQLHDGTGALLLSLMSAHYDMAAALLDAGANLNPATPGWTPLHQAVMSHSPATGHNNPYPVPHGTLTAFDVIRRLVRAGADVNARIAKEPDRAIVGRRGNSNTAVGATPFFIAAKAADVPLMRLLLELGADPHLPNHLGTTPLMAAAGVGIFEVGESPGTNAAAVEAVKLCLSLKPDVRVVDANGETALHGAAYRGAPEVVRLLVAAGVPLDVRNTRGWSAWKVADGVELGIIFHREPETASLLKALMVERGQWTDERHELAPTAEIAAPQ